MNKKPLPDDADHWKEVAERLAYQLAASVFLMHTEQLRTKCSRKIIAKTREGVANKQPIEGELA